MGTNQLGGGQVTNGEHPLVPSLPELIQRNLSRMKTAMRMMAKADSDVNRAFYQQEAERCIEMHNTLVEENKHVMNLRAGMEVYK